MHNFVSFAYSIKKKLTLEGFPRKKDEKSSQTIFWFWLPLQYDNSVTMWKRWSRCKCVYMNLL